RNVEIFCIPRSLARRSSTEISARRRAKSSLTASSWRASRPGPPCAYGSRLVTNFLSWSAALPESVGARVTFPPCLEGDRAFGEAVAHLAVPLEPSLSFDHEVVGVGMSSQGPLIRSGEAVRDRLQDLGF